MAIDPTIALNANGTQINPLAAQAGALEMANRLMGYRRLQAQQAVGQAVQQATDPNTGVVDQGKARALIAANPAAAMAAQDADSTSFAQQGASLTNEQQTLLNQARKISFIAGLAAPLAAKSDVTKADVQNQIQHAVNFGLIDAPTAQQALNSVPSDSAGVRSTLNGWLKANMAPSDEFAHIYGTPAQLNTGSNVVAGSMAPGDQGYGFRGATSTPVGLSPEAQAQQQTITGPNGETISQPMAGRLAAQGRGDLVSPGPTQSLGPGGKPTVPPEWARPGSGSYPGAQPQGGDFSGAGAPSAPGGGSVVTTPPAGQVAALGAVAAAGANGANALMSASASRNDRLSVLGNMSSDLSQFTSGPGYERLRKLQSFVNNYGGSWNVEGVENAQSFNKFAGQLAAAQATALGAGSDAKLAAAVHMSPNSALQSGTNKMMIHQLMGNEDAINAKAQAWQQSGLPPSQFQQWNQQFSQSFDPRAYQALRMAPEERTTFIRGLKDSGQLDAFRSNYNAMAAAGLVPGGAQSGGQ